MKSKPNIPQKILVFGLEIQKIPKIPQQKNLKLRFDHQSLTSNQPLVASSDPSGRVVAQTAKSSHAEGFQMSLSGGPWIQLQISLLPL